MRAYLLVSVALLSAWILASHGNADMVSDLLAAHNSARASVGVGPLSWSNEAAAFARSWTATLRDSRGCNLIHSGNRKYGENLYKWSGSPGLPPPNPAEAVRSWVGERSDYNYASNSCAPGKVCGHYTQVVWRNTQRVGCAVVTCSPNSILVSCNYDPPGNFNGQRPYLSSPNLVNDSR